MSDWRQELGSSLERQARAARAEQENAQFEEFLDKVALPALQDVAMELNGHGGCEVRVRRAPGAAALTVITGGSEDIAFRVLKHYGPNGILPSAEARVNRGAGFYAKYEGMMRDGRQDYTIEQVTKEDVIGAFIRYFRLVREGGAAPAAK